jgi:NADPH:quinone reductase-like Zn-dependent oxidoreductase
MGKRVYATSRDPGKRERIASLGATAVEPGARLPERVDVVIESVGAPTFDHSMKCSAPGARIVVCGATGGHQATIDLRRVFAMQLELLGSTMGTRAELEGLLEFLASNDLRPVIDSTYGFTAIPDAFGRLEAGDVFGKVAVDYLH